MTKLFVFEFSEVSGSLRFFKMCPKDADSIGKFDLGLHGLPANAGACLSANLGS